MKIKNKLFSILVLSLVLVGVSSCDKRNPDDNDDNNRINLSLNVGGKSTKGGGPSASEPALADVANQMSIFAFNQAAPHKYAHYIPKKSVAGTTIKTEAPSGAWNLVMAYFRNTTNFVPATPNPGASKDLAPLYIYSPTISGSGNSTISQSATEVFRGEQSVAIQPFVENIASAYMARNVALVQLVIKKSTMGIEANATAGSHKVYLHNVPSTISYGGKLLKSVGGSYQVDATNPDVLATPLEGRFEISRHDEVGFLKSDTVNFIIPAHMGSDFWLKDASGVVTGVNPNPTDISQLKMKVSLDLERPGGSRYVKDAEIPIVAQANKIIRVSINVNAGIAVGAEILPWNYVVVDENVGEKSSGAWLYVKKGSNGSGLSWGDAVGTISEGITKAQALKAAGSTVHGVLIAGGAARQYDEDIAVTSGAKGIRLYGGWEGIAGSELSATDNTALPSQPNTSLARKLATHKAVIGGNKGIVVNEFITYVDGFKVTGATSVTPLTLGANSDLLVANAIEITGNSSPQLFSSQSNTIPKLTNILIADNAGSSLTTTTNNFMMINATIASNNNIAISGGIFNSCAFWGNTGSVSFHTSFMYPQFSATDASLLSLMVGLSTSNNEEFGPRFNLTSIPKYSVVRAGSPLLDGGNSDMWHNLPISKDIDGNPRAIGLVDIGCYESPIQ